MLPKKQEYGGDIYMAFLYHMLHSIVRNLDAENVLIQTDKIVNYVGFF
jgi:hypothetical protein